MKRRSWVRWLLLGVGGLLLLSGAFLWNVSRPGRLVHIGTEPYDGMPVPLPVRIATLNLLHGYPDYADQAERLQRAEVALSELALDVLCLQEASRTPVVDNAAHRLAEALGMSGAYVRSNGNRSLIRFEEGAAVLARGGASGMGWLELRPQAGFFENRIVVWGVVPTEMGPVVVFCTHLTNGAESVNAGQMASLLDWVEAQRDGRPAVVAGDFNAEEHEVHMSSLPAHWHDAFRKAHPGETGGTSVDSGKRIDYIFLVDGSEVDWSVLDARTFGGAEISDHLGVLVQASLQSAK